MPRAMIRTAVLCAVIATPAHAARVDYEVDAGIEHDDNVHLSDTDPISQRIWRAGLGFLATQESSTVQAHLDGRVDYRDFNDDIYSDSVEGVLSGQLNWVLLPERLGFTIADELQLHPVDRFAPDAPDNRQQVNVLSLGPNFMFQLGPRMRGRVEARYIDTDAEVTAEFNSKRYGAAIRLERTLTPDSDISFNGQWQDVDYDADLLARDHQRTDVYGRYEHRFNHTDLAIDAGWSQVDYADGSRQDDPLLRGELGWRPTLRSRWTLVAIRQYSDTADSALAGIDAATEIPRAVLVDDTRVNPSVYAERRLAVGYHYTGGRTALQVEPYWLRIDYLDEAEPDEESHGVLLGLEYQLRPTVSLSAWADVQQVEYAITGTDEETWRTGIALEKRWTRHWSSSLSYYRYSRDGFLPAANVDQNVWYFSISYRNRPR